MTYFLGAILLNMVIFFFLSVFVYFKNRESRINQIWAAGNLILAAWFLCVGMNFFGLLSKAGALASIRIAHCFSILGPVLFYHFVLLLTERVEKRNKILKVFYLLSFLIILMITLFPKGFMKDAIPAFGLKYLPLGGPLYFMHILGLCIILISICYELITGYKESSGYKLNQIKYVFLGIFSAAFGMGTVIPVAFGIKMFPFGFYLVPLYGISITYAVVRYRLMDINILISKTLFSIFLLAPIIAFQIAFVSFLQSYGLSNIISNSLSVFIIIMVFLLTPFAYKLQQAANYLVYRGRYDYQDVLKESIKALVTILDINQLLKHIIDSIVRNFRTNKVSLFLEEEEAKEFRIKASYGLEAELSSGFCLKSEQGVISYLRGKQGVFIREEMKRAMPKSTFEKIYEELDKIGAEVIIPLVYKGELKGILNLDNKSSGQMYNQADLDILESLSAEAAISIENARLYRKVSEAEARARYADILQKQKRELEIAYREKDQAYEELKATQAQLIQSEKMATIGRLAGGVAHEINTPLGTILTNTEMLMVEEPATGYQRDSLKLIKESSLRCKVIVEQLLKYSRLPGPGFEMVDVDQVIDECYLLLERQLADEGIRVNKEYDQIPEIKGNANELRQVFTNIILNAKDAIKKTFDDKKRQGEIRIRAYQEGRSLVVEVQDDGCGISPEDIGKIFDPFFTTKDIGGGTGLGLSISQRIIERHRGKIEARSKVGQGTTMRVELPLPR